MYIYILFFDFRPDKTVVSAQGCYVDKTQPRDLPHPETGATTLMTPTLCITLCQNAGFKYAGVQVRMSKKNLVRA